MTDQRVRPLMILFGVAGGRDVSAERGAVPSSSGRPSGLLSRLHQLGQHEKEDLERGGLLLQQEELAVVDEVAEALVRRHLHQGEGPGFLSVSFFFGFRTSLFK